MDKISLNNLGTYKEIEYLKRTLGPVLVSALAEVCVKRPTDPIEYLGHWLLRWRYNEELKRRDIENAMEVIRQRQTVKCEREVQMAECKLPLDPYGQGVIPEFPYFPPGYGGPINPDDLRVKEEEEEGEIEYEMPGEDYPPPSYEMAGEDGYPYPYGNQMAYNNYDQGANQYDPNWAMQGQDYQPGQYDQQQGQFDSMSPQHEHQQNQQGHDQSHRQSQQSHQGQNEHHEHQQGQQGQQDQTHHGPTVQPGPVPHQVHEVPPHQHN